MGHLWKHALPRSKLLYLLLVTEVEKQGAEIGWDFGKFCVEGNKLKIYSILLKLSTLFKLGKFLGFELALKVEE